MPEFSTPAVLPDPPSTTRKQTEVFAIHGADPEVLAYAMARYSRSALSMKESLRQISAQRAEQFLNTFYFQYGHRSIADLAHLAFAIERLSLLAAIVLVDEQRWDGQERSTRYQDFEKSGWYLPAFASPEIEQDYTATVNGLFAAYRQVSDGVFASLADRVVRPETMKQEAFDRTLRARAFDVARYLLPLAANTSLGQIVNARTLEAQVSRLLSHPLAEVRELGERLREAAGGNAWNPSADAGGDLAAEVEALDPELGARVRALLTREVRVAPTLVKYAARSDYAVDARASLAQAAQELLGGEPIAPAPLVDLVENREGEGLEVELAASLLYTASHYPYRQIRDYVGALSSARRDEMIDLGLRDRGPHDELLREFSAGQSLRFDILMDIGGFRDMHRHRRCVQLIQDFTPLHGYEVPEGLAEAGLNTTYDAAMDAAHAGSRRAGVADGSRGAGQYLLPLGTRIRSLFKMDFAQALYIAELRSKPQGHFSYRRVAWEMYQAVARQHPSMARSFRVTSIAEPVDLLQR
jgi:thymidylate synthase ThyX